MRKINTLLITLTMCLIASHASAFPFTGGTDERFVLIDERESSNTPIPPGFGKLNADGKTYNEESLYDVFCVEYYAGISSSYKAGQLVKTYTVDAVGKSTDIHDNIKWLYAAYEEGFFSNDAAKIVAEINDNYKKKYHQQPRKELSSLVRAVQYGIWYHSENLQSMTDSENKRKMIASWDVLDDYLTETQNWSTYKNVWDIRSLEISYATGGPKSGIGHAQSQLVGAEVPEPASMALFGIGLMGLAGAVKRRRNSKKQ